MEIFFSFPTAANLRLAKGWSMRFTELGLLGTDILDNHNVIRDHLLHISFSFSYINLLKERTIHIEQIILYPSFFEDTFRLFHKGLSNKLENVKKKCYRKFYTISNNFREPSLQHFTWTTLYRLLQ